MAGAVAIRKARSPAATRQAEHRQRERDGVVCIYVPIARSVITALLDRGLPEHQATDARALGRELGDVLAQWAARWAKERNIS
jgi:hypothetical protein